MSSLKRRYCYGKVVYGLKCLLGVKPDVEKFATENKYFTNNFCFLKGKCFRSNFFMCAQTEKHLRKSVTVSILLQLLFPHLRGPFNILKDVALVDRAVSFECRKTKTKAITLANHNRHKHRYQPITTRSKCM